jgi:hypothetical protein
VRAFFMEEDEAAMSHGDFSGEPQTRWLTDEKTADRKMTVLEDFWFVDPKKKEWRTPAYYEVDGASIPRALWTLAGSPYTGDYRRASVVHDKACDDAKGNPSERRKADRMFFHACRAGGCSIVEATLLYLGVRIGSLQSLVPAWIDSESEKPHLARTASEKRLEADFELVGTEILSRGETDDPEELEARTDAALSRVTGVDLRGR